MNWKNSVKEKHNFSQLITCRLLIDLKKIHPGFSFYPILNFLAAKRCSQQLRIPIMSFSNQQRSTDHVFKWCIERVPELPRGKPVRSANHQYHKQHSWKVIWISKQSVKLWLPKAKKGEKEAWIPIFQTCKLNHIPYCFTNNLNYSSGSTYKITLMI